MKFLNCFVILCVFALNLIGCSRAASNVNQVANAGLQKSVVYLPIVTSPLQFHSRKILLGKSGTTDVFVNRYSSDVYFLGHVIGNDVFHYDSVEDKFTLNVLKDAPILSDAVQLDQKRNKLYVPLRFDRLYIFSKGVIEAEINVGRVSIDTSALNEEDGTFYIIKHSSEVDQLLVIRNNVIENAIDYRKAIPYSGGYLNPKSMIVDSVNNLAYLAVSHSDDNANTVGFVVVIDLDSYEMTSFEIGRYAKKMGIKRKNGTVYVNHAPHGSGENTISIFRAGKLLRQQQLDGSRFKAVTDVIVDQNTNELYFVSEPDWKVYYLQDENDSLVLKSVVSVEKWPAKVAYDEVRRYLYTANYDTDTVSVIHEGKLLATVAVGWEPYGIGVHPETGVVYVSDTRELAITILTPYSLQTYIPNQ